jgi:hypothetical protein
MSPSSQSSGGVCTWLSPQRPTDSTACFESLPPMSSNCPSVSDSTVGVSVIDAGADGCTVKSTSNEKTPPAATVPASQRTWVTSETHPAPPTNESPFAISVRTTTLVTAKVALFLPLKVNFAAPSP